MLHRFPEIRIGRDCGEWVDWPCDRGYDPPRENQLKQFGTSCDSLKWIIGLKNASEIMRRVRLLTDENLERCEAFGCSSKNEDSEGGWSIVRDRAQVHRGLRPALCFGLTLTLGLNQA